MAQDTNSAAVTFTISVANLPAGAQYASPNEFAQALGKVFTVQPDTDWYSFYAGTAEPTYDMGPWLKPDGSWAMWNTTLAKYTPVTLGSTSTGDTKFSYTSGDDVSNGWVVLDGRHINDITTISTSQRNVLSTLFGVAGKLPTAPSAGTVQCPAHIAAPAVQTYDLIEYVSKPFAIDSITIKLLSGTATLQLDSASSTPVVWERNDGVSGTITSLAITSTQQTFQASSSNTVAIAAALQLIVSAVSSAATLTATIQGHYTDGYWKVYAGPY